MRPMCRERGGGIAQRGRSLISTIALLFLCVAVLKMTELMKIQRMMPQTFVVPMNAVMITLLIIMMMMMMIVCRQRRLMRLLNLSIAVKHPVSAS